VNLDLQQSLANNARAWQELSLAISSSEKEAFDKVHDGLFAQHGSNFMAQVYRTAFEQMLKHMPDAERSKLLLAFEEAIQEAVAHNRYLTPTTSQCNACHSSGL